MTSKWQECYWGDLATLEYGKGLRGYENGDGPYRVYGTNGPIGRHSKPLCDHPGVIVGRKGAYRGIHFASEPFYVIDTAFYLEPKKDIDIKWAYYELLTHDINNMDSGSAIPSTSRDAFYSMKVKVPPLPEQQAIAHILGSLDDKIELNRQMNETLEDIARTLFKSWFVDFDPVRAKMEGRQPYGMDAETAALFPDGFEDSVLGKIPKGWQIKTLTEVITMYDSKRVPLSSRERVQRRGPYPYYGAASIIDFVDNYLFDGIYVLMGEDGSVINEEGHPFIQYVWGKFWVNNHAHILQGRGYVSNEHILLFLQSLNISPYVTGAVQLKLNQSNMSKIPFLLPPFEICERLDKMLSSLYTGYRANSDQISTLSALRDALLPKLLSGEIRVKDAEKEVEAVM